MNVGKEEYEKLLKRRARQSFSNHKIRLGCIRGQDGLCTDGECKRPINYDGSSISVPKAVEEEYK